MQKGVECVRTIMAGVVIPIFEKDGDLLFSSYKTVGYGAVS